ncbi:alpha-hydroxy acid oxidase [Quisquiliibacterium transsilvanicum]|uniref:Isopentenyl diphosphate isomerase/L-lactate dehydrogenase-like FMN-dependent dehydrogenase n=1 Tax=Quisquiliibacterium transsilvanicum TaxID=1549638 RepID=A0A7W8M9S0_9BURK|nr:alpha-hydroxy acid oxidase [Quisquiliibacterium transsilvanicum]MBB5273193.1 isopentenyl diphosphate isomerase/L-lactate dehydrogenase-like FMN-dependent dehydrogenase [Quisquiliibacterium transsilvanicum]
MPARLPDGIHCAADYSRLAAGAIDAPTLAYIDGGSGEDRTLAANRAAFGRLGLVPRLLPDLRGAQTRLSLLGQELAHPILLAPVAYQALAHPRAEIETARGAAAAEACMACSTLSSASLEEVAAHAGPQRWFQLYFQPQRAATLDLVRRAEAAGYTALVVTLDAAIQAPSLRALRAGFRMPAGLRAANLADYPPTPPKSPAPLPGASRIFQAATRDATTWADLDWLAAQTSLPLLVKGVLHPEDAGLALDHGAAGLVVSNHGGRTIDGAPASLSVLPSIRQAVGPGCPLLLDGGVRSGAGAFKAIALGADAVMVGRLQVHALAVAGALGVAHMIRLLREELELCMAATGCRTLADIHDGLIHRFHDY